MGNTTSYYRPAKLSAGTRLWLLSGIALCLLFLIFAALLGGCTASQVATVKQAESVVVADASSPAGQQILADVTSSALNVGLDVASGNDVGAAIAGVQGAASAIRDYEGLPVAPSSATIARAAAAGSGVAAVALTLTPAVESLVDQALKSAKGKRVNLSVDAITEAIARGFDAVANAKPPVSLAGSPGEAP